MVLLYGENVKKHRILFTKTEETRPLNNVCLSLLLFLGECHLFLM